MGTADRANVQTAFGWTDAQFGRLKHDVAFEIVFTDAPEYACTSGAVLVGGPPVRTFTIVHSTWQGRYVFSGYGTSTTVGSLLQPGDPCPNGDGSTVVREDAPFFTIDLDATVNDGPPVFIVGLASG
jgi:hypothetical protein